MKVRRKDLPDVPKKPTQKNFARKSVEN